MITRPAPSESVTVLPGLVARDPRFAAALAGYCDARTQRRPAPGKLNPASYMLGFLEQKPTPQQPAKVSP